MLAPAATSYANPSRTRGISRPHLSVGPMAFGNALGSSIAEASQSRGGGVDWGNAPDQSDAEAARLNRYQLAAQAADDRGYFPSESVLTGQTLSDAFGSVNSFDPTAERSARQTKGSRLELSSERYLDGSSDDLSGLSTAELMDRVRALLAKGSATSGEPVGPGLRLSSSSGGGLASRFTDGLWGAVKGATVEPLLQLRDLSLAGASVVYNELLRDDGDGLWLPEMKSGIAEGYANGASQTRLLLQAFPLTAPSVASYDLTTAAMNGDWGGVVEGAGSLAGGLAIGKGVSKYGGYGLTFDDIGATGPMASQLGAIRPRLVSPEVTPREFNLLVNDRNGILSTLSKEGIVDFKINAVGSPMRGAEMFDRMMQSYGDDVAGIRGNWMNMDADASNKNLGIVNKLTAQGLPLEEAVVQTWTAQQASRYGYTAPVVQMDRVVGQPGNYSKVETIFYKEDK